MPLVRVDGIAFDVGGGELFAETTFAIEPGENWAIVGPSGSGKSLLAMAIASQIPLSRGAVRYEFLAGAEAEDARFGWFPRGAVLRVSPDDARRMAQQDSGYHQARWHASESAGRDTVSERLTRQSVLAINPFQVLDESQDQAAFELRRTAAIDTFGLRPLLDRAVHQLSHGETKKLVLARAWIRQPRLLIVDDPFAGLDVGFRQTLRDALDRLAASGVTLVIVTPRPEELPSCVNRALLVEHHRVQAVLLSRAELDARTIDEGSAQRPPSSSPRDPSDGAPLAAPGSPPQAAESSGRTARQARETGAALVRLRNVSVRYGRSVVLSNVSLTVLRGEHWVLLGPNGAGKTTLLSLIVADNPQAYANEVEVFGKRRGTGGSIWDIKARIGSASPELHAHMPRAMDALDVVASGFEGTLQRTMDCSLAQVEKATALLSDLVPKAARRTFGELSFGEQRLVLIARAMVGARELLILDEPCHGLDATNRAHVIEAVNRAARTGGASIIYVTHQADEVPECITHVLELREGRAVRCGPLRKGSE
jgi:molybdate transport system ATP-binding protein